MQGSVDDSDLEFGRTNLGAFSTEEKLMFVDDSTGMKTESGTWNICSAPCSSCMHDFHSSSVIGSTSESGCSGNISSREKADICFSVDANGKIRYKSRICDDSQNASSETSNMLGMSSSHNSYSENAGSKSTQKDSVAHDLEDLDKPQLGLSGEVSKEEKSLEKKIYQAHFSADSHLSSPLGCRDSAGQVEEQLGLECHGDNISCITAGTDANISDSSDNLCLDKKDKTCGVVLTNDLILNMNETSVLVEAGDGPQDHGTEESDFNLQRSNENADASILHDTSNSASVSTTPDNSGFSSLRVDVYSTSWSSISHAKNICSSFQKADFGDAEENMNKKLQAGCMAFVNMDNAQSLLASFSSVSSAGGKPATLRNVEVSGTNEARSCLSPEKSKLDDLCREFRTDTNSQISSNNGSRSGDLNEALEKDNALLDLETSNRQGSNFLPLASTEIENSESESALYDVKVCDICGDVGREALLAICSRCSDGAEHTYCMWEKLEELPGVNWLCEECQIKETQNLNVEKSETISGGLKQSLLSRRSQNSFSALIPKKLPELDAGATDLDVRGLAMGLESPKISTRRQAYDVDETKASEASAVPIETASPRTPVFSRVLSSKNQKIKLKKANMESYEAQSVKGLQAFHHSQNSFSSGSLKNRPQAHSPYRHFSRSVSLSNSIINQDVKQPIKNARYKQKNEREAMSSKLRNETLAKSINKSASFKSSSLGFSNTESTSKDQPFFKSALAKSINKSASFKSSSSGFSNTESASKDQPFHPSLIENPSGLNEVKERITFEKKNPSAIHKTSISKLAAPASIWHLKRKRTSSQKEGNVKGANESSCQSIVKRTYAASDLGCNDSKKQILHSSRTAEISDEKFNSANHKQWKEVKMTDFSAIDRSCIKADTASQHDVLKPSDFDPKDNKIRDSKTFISPRLPSSGGDQTLNLQKRNKTGHATQQCLTEELQGSTYRPSEKQSSSEVMKKGKEYDDVVDAMVPKTRMLSKGKSLDKIDTFPVTRAEMICIADSRNTRGSFSRKNIALAVDRSNDNNSLRKFSIELGQAVAATDSVDLAVHPTEPLLVPKANQLNHIPTFNELNISPSETSSGEASILASQLRASAIPKLECIWQGSFNVLRSDTCLQLFDGIQAHLSTCASHKVLEVAKVIPNKMMLEEVSQSSLWLLQCPGIVPKEENIALFFFAKDNESYEKSYSFLLNEMLKNDSALRGKVDEAELLIFTSKMLPAYSHRWNILYYLWGTFIGKKKHCLPTQKKNCESTMGIEYQGISELPLRNGPNAQNLDATAPSKKKQRKSTMCVDLHCLSSEVEHKTCGIKAVAYAVDSLSQVVTDAKMMQEIPLLLMDNSSKTTAEPLDIIDSSELQDQTSQLGYEVTIGVGCQDKFVCDGTNKKIGESPHISDTSTEASLGRTATEPSASPNSNPVEEHNQNECKKKKRHCSPTDFTILDYNPSKNVSEIDWADKKQVRSCSTETVSQSSGERIRWMLADDEREHNITHYGIGSSSGEENLSSAISSQHQHTHNIFSEPVTPEISTTVERSFFPMDISSSSDNKYGGPAHIISWNDDDNTESYTLDLELTLGRKSKTMQHAPLFPFLLPSVDRGRQNRQSGSGNDGDGDDLSALLSL